MRIPSSVTLGGKYFLLDFVLSSLPWVHIIYSGHTAGHGSESSQCPGKNTLRKVSIHVVQIHFLQYLLVLSQPVYFWSPQTLPVNSSQGVFAYLLPCLFFLRMNAETQLGSCSVCLHILQFPFQVLQKPLHTLLQGCTKGPVIFHYSASILLGWGKNPLLFNHMMNEWPPPKPLK